MNHKLSLPYLQKGFYILCIAALVATLTIGLAPAQTARADAITTTSDLKVRIISMPKEVKACQTFRATFSVKNLGPDPASHLYIMVRLPDPFELVRLRGAPESLRVGQTVTFSAVIKVVAFVPGEPRKTWLGIDAMSDPYPDLSIDPNPDNNPVFRNIRMVSKPVLSCP
ncbi:MAG TPA: hypothetical protein VLE49_13530 [Anaerolineales bacterium]|nr:hypothetical protein [Anaerolineales bacterium]